MHFGHIQSLPANTRQRGASKGFWTGHQETRVAIRVACLLGIHSWGWSPGPSAEFRHLRRPISMFILAVT